MRMSRGYYVARNRPNPTSTKSRPSWYSKFVPGDLTDDEKKACKVWSAWDDDPDTVITRLIDTHYKVTVKDDSRSKGYVAFITPDGDGHTFAGWMLGGRGSSPLKAIKQACYRHFVSLDEVWPAYSDDDERADFDD